MKIFLMNTEHDFFWYYSHYEITIIMNLTRYFSYKLNIGLYIILTMNSFIYLTIFPTPIT